MFKFNNGDKVRCMISGFTGVIISRVQWFNGCIRYTVQPRGTKQAELKESKAFDELELKLVKAQEVPSVTFVKRVRRASGGPSGSRSAPSITSR